MDICILEDNLIVSSPGIGGLTYLEGKNQVIVSSNASTGIYLGDEGFFCGLQENGGNHLLCARDGSSQIVELDNNAQDIHDVLINDGFIYYVATQNNEIVCLDCNFKRLKSWQLLGEEDSSHINSITIYKGRLIASAFGNFKKHREYKTGTLGLGRVFDVQTGETLISGLSQPHSLTVEDDDLYLCSSEEKMLHVYKNQQLNKTVLLPGYARGVAAGKKYIYVGISLSRNIDSTDSKITNGAIAVINRQSMECIGLNILPFREVYDIRIVNRYSDIFSIFAPQHQELKSLKNDLEHCKKDIQYLNRVIEDQDKMVSQIMNSMSWRITKPLRRISSAITQRANKKI